MLVVVGAGAAGLLAAITAAEHGADVLMLERTADGGRKILISGGGRCNVLPSQLAPERFVTDSKPHVMRALLRSWPLAAQRTFFEQQLRLPLALEAETGKLFPVSNRARDVRDGLIAYAQSLGVRFRFQTAVTDLTPRESGWMIVTGCDGLDADRVIVATGGLSVPATGSDGIGLSIVERLGHRIHQVYPALTPLLAEPPVHAGLSGVSLTVRLRARDARHVTESTGGFLFTHRGYSGPSVLDLSHVAVRSRLNGGAAAAIRVRWAPLDAAAWTAFLTSGTGLVVNAVAAHVPQRLAARLMEEAAVPLERRVPDLRRTERTGLVDRLTSYLLPWTADEGFKKAEVTGGGVALDEVDPATLESRRHPGLFLCGEILDAFGPIGGHNFAWAWATGRLAGLGAARR